MKVTILKLTQIVMFLSLLNIGAMTHAAPEKAKSQISKPRLIQLEYEVTRDGKPFATVKERYSQDGKQYQIESITKGVGVYALFGERKLTSQGSITPQGLQPNHFELHQGGSAKKSLITDFDWAENMLNMQVKGKIKTATLEKSTQDLASYAYQFMHTPPKTEEIKVTLTTGKKLNQYVYTVADSKVAIEAADQNFKTIQLTSKTAEDSKQLWLAEEYFYLPVRYVVVEDGTTLQQTLTKIHVE
jgi:Protein of unknown function (DUF3108)